MQAPAAIPNSPVQPFQYTYNRRIYLTLASAAAFAVVAIAVQWLALQQDSAEERARKLNLVLSAFGGLLSLMLLVFMLYRLGQVVGSRGSNLLEKRRAGIVRRASFFSAAALVPLALWSAAFAQTMASGKAADSAGSRAGEPVSWLMIAASVVLLLQAVWVLPNWRPMRQQAKFRFRRMMPTTTTTTLQPVQGVQTLGGYDGGDQVDGYGYDGDDGDGYEGNQANGYAVGYNGMPQGEARAMDMDQVGSAEM
jgi:hypothetical protein